MSNIKSDVSCILKFKKVETKITLNNYSTTKDFIVEVGEPPRLPKNNGYCQYLHPENDAVGYCSRHCVIGTGWYYGNVQVIRSDGTPNKNVSSDSVKLTDNEGNWLKETSTTLVQGRSETTCPYFGSYGCGYATTCDPGVDWNNY